MFSPVHEGEENQIHGQTDVEKINCGDTDKAKKRLTKKTKTDKAKLMSRTDESLDFLVFLGLWDRPI